MYEQHRRRMPRACLRTLRVRGEAKRKIICVESLAQVSGQAWTGKLSRPALHLVMSQAFFVDRP